MGLVWYTTDKITLVESLLGKEPLLGLRLEGSDYEMEFTAEEAGELSHWFWMWYWEHTPSEPSPTPVENLMLYLRQAKEIMTTKNLMPELCKQIDEALKKEASKYGVDV